METILNNRPQEEQSWQETERQYLKHEMISVRFESMLLKKRLFDRDRTIERLHAKLQDLEEKYVLPRETSLTHYFSGDY